MDEFKVMLFTSLEDFAIEVLTRKNLLELQTTFLGARTDIRLCNTNTSPWMNRYPILRRECDDVKHIYCIIPSCIPCVYDNVKATTGRFVIYKLIELANGESEIATMGDDDIDFIATNISNVHTEEAIKQTRKEYEEIMAKRLASEKEYSAEKETVRKEFLEHLLTLTPEALVETLESLFAK